MRTLATRSLEPELMDGAGLGDAALHARCLADLAAVNRVTLAHRPVLRFLDAAWQRAGLVGSARLDPGVVLRSRRRRTAPPRAPTGVLDLGSGQGDLLRAIARLALARGVAVRLTGLDLHPHSTAAARAATAAAADAGDLPPGSAPIRFLTGDLFAHAADEDWIVCSQLAHHLDDAGIVALLRWLEAHSRRGWCIADLERHRLPHLSFPLIARAFGWHRVVRLDGTRSIERALTPAEWRARLDEAGIRDAHVERWPMFRIAVTHATPGRPP
jgi:SAM-dependent methyltransferase